MTIDDFANSVKLMLLQRYECDAAQIAFMMAMWPEFITQGYAQEHGPMTVARTLMDAYLEHEPKRAKKR